MSVQKFHFKLLELPVELPDGWVPFAAESDPELGIVWIWARKP